MVVRKIRRLASREFRQAGFHEQGRIIRAGIAGLPETATSNLARLSPKSAAFIDGLQFSKFGSWGGPMNGQAGRQQLLRELVKVVDPAAVVETGTYRATTTEFLWHLTGKSVYSVELERRYFEYAKRRCGRNGNIHLYQADSREFLGQLGQDPEVPKKRVLFYLDAHWGEDLPLGDELRLIDKYWKDPIVIIDDFRVPGDSGYRYDDYGEGRSLTIDYLPLSEMEDLVVLFPSLPSECETGLRRGCALLVKRDREVDLLAALPLRRPEENTRTSRNEGV